MSGKTVGDAGIEPANTCPPDKWPALSLISDCGLLEWHIELVRPTLAYVD